ncbi:hypothetical protein K440DRAFT_540207 [Wilcoxina mikolae CBS 423.85]|nr:hypothetical protein K440DRAFT_540207 [Wilcoxina mikolae CBS 423.85]
MSRHIFKHVGGDVEYPERYVVGGFHPVHIGDKFHNGRYVILRKVGYGAFSIVWLAKDIILGMCAALKITTADVSSQAGELKALLQLRDAKFQHLGHQNVLQLLDYFNHKGPNGSHLCLVLEAMDLSAVQGISPLPL